MSCISHTGMGQEDWEILKNRSQFHWFVGFLYVYMELPYCNGTPSKRASWWWSQKTRVTWRSLKHSHNIFQFLGLLAWLSWMLPEELDAMRAGKNLSLEIHVSLNPQELVEIVGRALSMYNTMDWMGIWGTVTQFPGFFLDTCPVGSPVKTLTHPPCFPQFLQAVLSPVSSAKHFAVTSRVMRCITRHRIIHVYVLVFWSPRIPSKQNMHISPSRIGMYSTLFPDTDRAWHRALTQFGTPRCAEALHLPDDGISRWCTDRRAKRTDSWTGRLHFYLL